jgi:hypothetical protein
MGEDPHTSISNTDTNDYIELCNLLNLLSVSGVYVMSTMSVLHRLPQVAFNLSWLSKPQFNTVQILNLEQFGITAAE